MIDTFGERTLRFYLYQALSLECSGQKFLKDTIRTIGGAARDGKWYIRDLCKKNLEQCQHPFQNLQLQF